MDALAATTDNNTLPQYSIAINDTEICTTLTEVFTVYIIDVKCGSLSWKSKKRYNAFRKMKSHIKSKYSKVNGFPKFPSRWKNGTLINQFDKCVISDRKSKLEAYLKFICNNASTCTDAKLLEFLKEEETEIKGRRYTK